MKVISPPVFNKNWNAYHVFLAGSIEMGRAKNWQMTVANLLSNLPDDLVLMNPRRLDWDDSWEQTIKNANFKEQVEWELYHLESANLAAFYFDPETKAPVSLLELGLTLGADSVPTVVACPPGYWRRGNVEIVCDKFNIPLLDSLDDLIKYIKVDYDREYSRLSWIERHMQDLRNGV